MARTKQTARHSTGDMAPRCSLGKPKKAPKRKPVPKPRDDDDYAPTSKRKRGPAAAGDTVGDEPMSKKRSNPSRSRSVHSESVAVDSPPSVPLPTAEHVDPPPQVVVERIDVDALFASKEPEDVPNAAAEEEVSDSEDEEDVDRPDKAWESTLYATPPTFLPQEFQRLAITDLSNCFCYLCQNGGASLRCCECPRTVCLKHIPEIAAVDENIRDTLHFRCPSCHVRATRNDQSAPYRGLYETDADGNVTTPYLPRWATVDVAAARPQHVQVDTRPIIILSVRLHGLDEESCPARLLYNYVLPWFEGPAKGYLRYVDIPFSIRNTGQADRYRAKWTKVFAALGPITDARIVVFIYTHSHDKTGDLFFAQKMCSSNLRDWWLHVMPRELTDIARFPSNELTIVVLACGAVVNKLRPRKELNDLAMETGALQLFSFGASCLQAVLTTPFFMNYAQRVWIEGTKVTDRLIVTILEQSLFLARHTTIWMFRCETVNAEFTIERYEWTHLTMHPHGHDIGLQCPNCGCLSTRKGFLTDNDIILVVCKNTDCGWSKAFLPPAKQVVKVRMIKLAEHGRWRTCTMVKPSSLPSA